MNCSVLPHLAHPAVPQSGETRIEVCALNPNTLLSNPAAYCSLCMTECARFSSDNYLAAGCRGRCPLFIHERSGYWALPPLSPGLLAARLFGCQATPSMMNIVVTLVHFLCGLRWELPSVLGTAQSRDSPSRSWCQRHCTLALLPGDWFCATTLGPP